MQGVRLHRDELINTYGISQRLAVRIGALLAKGLETTSTILEISGPGSALERLLLHPRLLAEAGHLDTSLARQLAAETGADQEGELVVVESEGRKVLALEEEILAEEGWRRTAEETSLAEPDREMVPAGPDLREARRLFSADEIARLKLEVLAGRDAESRISALKKLLFAPVGVREKGAICLRALLDREPTVRTEAIRALESLGFNRDVADAIQSVFEGEARVRKAALRRLGGLLDGLRPTERQVVLAVILEVFREASLSGPADPLLDLLHQSADLVGAHPEIASELTRVSVRHLLMEPVRLGGAIRDLLLRLAQVANQQVVEKVWEELPTVRDPAPRGLLLGLLVEADRDPGRQEKLCQAVVDELLREDRDELSRQKLGHNLLTLGPAAARALVRRFRQASLPERARLVGFLDVLCVDKGLPPREREEVAGLLLEALKLGDRHLRSEVLRTRIWHLPDLPPRVRADLARELLSLLRSGEQPEVADRAAALLESLGTAAARELFDTIRRRPSAPEADIAVRILGRILTQPEAASEVGSRFLDAVFQFLCGRVRQRVSRLGGYAATLGEVAASVLKPEQAREAFRLLTSRFGRAPYHADLVAAIGRLGASEAVTQDQRVEAVHLLGGLVDRPPDEKEEVDLRPVTTDKGTVYHLAGRIEFDSEILPAAVQGLEGIARSGRTSDALRERIVEVLLRVWEEVASWRRVWGPRGAEALAGALGRMGTDERATDALRARILKALGGALERISVVRALRDLFAAPSGSAEFDRLCVNIALAMLEQWIEPEIAPEELAAVLAAAAQAAARPGVSSRWVQARRLRERAVQLLFDALRSGETWCREPLEKLRDSPSVPKRMRSEIGDRLRKAFALVKA